MSLDLYRRLLAGENGTYVPPRARWRLIGPDAPRYLNGQVTNDVIGLADGEGCAAAVCSAKGRMEGEIFISRRGAEFYLDGPVELRESLGARLEKYLIADDAIFEEVNDLWSLSHVFGATLPEIPAVAFAIPHARYGLPGHDIWVPASGACIAGESVEADLVETLRLEHGIPVWGRELTPTTLPPEGGPRLLAAISYTKGCYVGQETIARLKSVGHVNKTLVFLRSDSDVSPEPGARLIFEEKEVGVVTSSGYSPRLERGVALGYVQRVLAKDGTVLQANHLPMTLTPSLFPEAA